jgi:hypothetical protein
MRYADRIACMNERYWHRALVPPPRHRFLTTTRFIFGIFSEPPSPPPIPFFFDSFSASRSRFTAATATPVGAMGVCNGSRSSSAGIVVGRGGREANFGGMTVGFEVEDWDLDLALDLPEDFEVLDLDAPVAVAVAVAAVVEADAGFGAGR